MPLAAIIAPVAFGVYRAFAGDDGALAEFGRGVAWPGAAIYIVTLLVLWGGWTLNLDE